MNINIKNIFPEMDYYFNFGNEISFTQRISDDCEFRKKGGDLNIVPMIKDHTKKIRATVYWVLLVK